MNACICVCVRVCTRVFMQVCTCVRSCVGMHVHIHALHQGDTFYMLTFIHTSTYLWILIVKVHNESTHNIIKLRRVVIPRHRRQILFKRAGTFNTNAVIRVVHAFEQLDVKVAYLRLHTHQKKHKTNSHRVINIVHMYSLRPQKNVRHLSCTLWRFSVVHFAEHVCASTRICTRVYAAGIGIKGEEKILLTSLMCVCSCVCLSG